MKAGAHPTLSETLNLVRGLFANRLDRGGKPYWLHCDDVRLRLGAYASEEARHAALLHDVLEDTDTTPDGLASMGFSARVLDLVERLSRPRDGSTYMDWIANIATSGDEELIRIKLADNQSNSDPARIACLPEADRTILRRYTRARTILEEGLARAVSVPVSSP